MADKELPVRNNTTTLSYDDEEPLATYSDRKEGGWITFPFITVGVAGLTVAATGWMSNLIVYLIQQFNIKDIQATQTSNIVNGCSSFFPTVGAVIADSLLRNFVVISISSFADLLSLGLLTLTATLHSLRPSHCKGNSEACDAPSHFQFAVLYSAITLVSIGIGGTRLTLGSRGANQLDKAKDQGTFFNWYFFTSAVIPITIRKRKVLLSSEHSDYYYGRMGETKSGVVEVLRLTMKACCPACRGGFGRHAVKYADVVF